MFVWLTELAFYKQPNWYLHIKMLFFKNKLKWKNNEK